MAGQDSIGNRTNWETIEARLRRGDKVADIAEDEGLDTDTFGKKFKGRFGLSPTAWALQQNPALENRRGVFGGGAIDVNEHYFDDFAENPAPGHAYVLGILYGRPIVRKKDCFEFASRYETLVDIVRTEFESKHKSTQLPEGTSILIFTGVRHLYQTLLSLGFGVKAKERPFPEVDESVISHFMRGIVEANAGIKHRDYRVCIEFTRFGIQFLTTMNSHLQHYAGVRRHVSNTPQFSYAENNSF